MTFFIAKFRYKIAFAFAAGVIMLCIDALVMNIPLDYFLANYGLVCLFLLAASAFLWWPAFKYYSSDPKGVWDSWGRCGRQKKRSEFQDFKFDKVYPKTAFGLAKEPHKGYRTLTTLDSCTCPEWRQNHLPCIHMYKLADQLGYYRPLKQRPREDD